MEKGRSLSLVKLETGITTSENKLVFFKRTENDIRESLSIATPETTIVPLFFLLASSLENKIEFNRTPVGKHPTILEK